MSKPLRTPEYYSIPQADDDVGFVYPQAHASKLRRVQHRDLGRWALRVSLAANILLASLSAYLGAILYDLRQGYSFSQGFEYELRAAKDMIRVEERMFEGSPRFRDDGTEFVPGATTRTRYVGEPSKEVDDAWDVLHQGRFFMLSEDEARDAWGSEYSGFHSPDAGGYVTELEVMHTLHCLDHIRKAFYPDIYPPDSDIHGVMHRDHCIDHLRQTVMCNSDLTPIPTRFYSGIHQSYIDSDRPHTCRSWENIRGWVWDRFNGSLEVPREEHEHAGHTHTAV